MFLHDLPRPLGIQSKIVLHPTLRAPIAVTTGSKIYVTFRRVNSWGFPEFIISPYGIETWPDMWNLDLQLLDSPGQIERLLKIFDRFSIRVLHYVSRAAYNSRYHSKYFVLDCTSYDSSEIDLRPSDRERDPNNGLLGLYYNIIVEFLHEIRINPDNSPVLRLYRNMLHWNMWEDIRYSRDDRNGSSLHQPAQTTYRKDGFEIPPPFLNELNLNKNSYVVSSVNVKSHAIYCGVQNIENPNAIHISIYFSQREIGHSQIASVMRAMGLNIVRSQLAQRKLGSTSFTSESDIKDNELSTLNILASTAAPIDKNNFIKQLNSEFSSFYKKRQFFAKILNPVKFHQVRSRLW
ncbi:MAG: hypothetical protein NW215_02755 [Hyphomicrobiales bacterium]|nr:hypothetical protein [Hyphomicrobiales bacterium]